MKENNNSKVSILPKNQKHQGRLAWSSALWQVSGLSL